MLDECKKCGLSVDVLDSHGISLEDDGNCSICKKKLMDEWKKDRRDQERHFRNTRF
jgi:hypothetical protein